MKPTSRELRACDTCHDLYLPRQQGVLQLYCSERCRAKHDNDLRRKRHPDRVKAWWDANPNYQQNLMRKKRDAVFEAYGGAICACCGEDHIEFLTVDHINGGGNKHRGSISQNFYNWLIDNNFPEGFRVLCMNCNFARRFGRKCPHDED